MPAVLAPVNGRSSSSRASCSSSGREPDSAAILVIVDTLFIVTPVNLALGGLAEWWWVGLLRIGIALALYLAGPGDIRVGGDVAGAGYRMPGPREAVGQRRSELAQSLAHGRYFHGPRSSPFPP